MAVTEVHLHRVEKIDLSETRDFGPFQARTIFITHADGQVIEIVLYSKGEKMPAAMIDTTIRECFK